MVGVTLLVSGLVFAGMSADGGPQQFFDKYFAGTGGVAERASGKVPGPQYLTCPAVRDRVGLYLKHHYTYRSFSKELSQRTFDMYFRFLDPGKNFFLASDIERFRKFETTLPMALARLDCSFITEVYNLFLQRVQESQAMVDGVLAKPFDFKVDESIETDRKKIPWAANSEDLRERWRKLFKFMAMSLRESESDNQEVVRKLHKRHELLRKVAEERTPDEIHDAFIKSFSFSLDPHSLHYTREELEDFAVAFRTQLEGIGATLISVDGYTVIEDVVPGGPAAIDGTLQKNDKIIAVDSGDGNGFVNVVDMQLNKVVQLIRGKKGSKVRLSILRKDEKGEVTKFSHELTRDQVNIPDAVAKSKVIDVGGRKVGVVELPSFYIDYDGCRIDRDSCRSSANDVNRELKKLAKQNVAGVMLDLRYNGGGDLGECVRLVGGLLDDGTVVQVQDHRGNVDTHEDPIRGTFYNGPLAVLVSKQSASASEILAGAVKSYGRGLVVGDTRTYGKGTVQKVIELREVGGALKVTEQKFFMPAGGSNQSEGILSDVVVPGPMEGMEIGEETNEFALPHSEIASARGFKRIRDFSPLLPELRKRSEARVAKSEDFKKLFELIKKSKEDETVFSLKVDDKKSEKDAKSKDAGKKNAKNDARGKKPGGTDGEGPDFQLEEAARVLIDGIDLVGAQDWAHISAQASTGVSGK